MLWNEAGEVTETTYAKIAIESNGRLVAPPVTSGLLPGVFRKALLAKGKLVEARVILPELRNAQRILLVNSARKRREARFVPNEGYLPTL